MILSNQLLSLLFSFAYGILTSYLYNLSYNFLYKTKIYYKILINILFSLIIFLIYFLLIKVINYGVIHIYFIFSYLIGFILFTSESRILRNVLKVSKKNVNKKKKD